MEEKHKTTLSPKNGDFYKIAFGFIRIWYLLFIRHITCFFFFITNTIIWMIYIGQGVWVRFLENCLITIKAD